MNKSRSTKALVPNGSVSTKAVATKDSFQNFEARIGYGTGNVAAIIVDKHNHGWDAVRYSLDGYIKRRGGSGVWAKLAA